MAGQRCPQARIQRGFEDLSGAAGERPEGPATVKDVLLSEGAAD